ncbi:MAG: SDR family oxidoreductase [Rhizobiaceae bacterium]|nr:SDR family oxidoreductase [Rhizobiaceae bacterium]
MTKLAGKRILVTAAASGIGRAIAERAAASGADVLATDVNGDALAAVQGERIRIARLDATDSDAIALILQAEDPFDGLVNAVGYVHHGTIEDCTPEDWRRSFIVNVDSAYLMTRAVLPAMVKAGRGSIVTISSVASSLKGIPFRFGYGATKAALIGMTKSIAIDYIAKGIRCNAICPGTIESPSLQERMRALGETMGGYEAARQSFIDRQPMGRLGTPQEVAALAVYLLSDESSFTTGQTHIIDGGILA